MKKAVIVGAGLTETKIVKKFSRLSKRSIRGDVFDDIEDVGNMMGLYLAKDGYMVDIYEKYSDPRIRKPCCFRSINLTLGLRGMAALEEVGLLEGVLRDSMPARGRVVWSGSGTVLGKVDYGERGESIHSVSRFDTNVFLLNEVEKLQNVNIHFGHELVSCDFEEGSAIFSCFQTEADNDEKNHCGQGREGGNKKTVTVTGNIFIGADGAHSSMRAEMSKHKKLEILDFKYHPHYYLEMHIPPNNNEYQLEKNRLHIWPKDSFVLICLPNTDKSFSGTLVMPKEKFDTILSSQKSLIAFFRNELTKVYDLVGEKNLIKQFFPKTSDPRSPCRLASLKCEPYHASSASGETKFVLLGDAAHAMVPFYGQGMNTGFEDVQILYHLLQKHGCSAEGIASAIEAFSANRCKDGQAMSDISYDHYKALCSNVKKANYNLRRHVDSALHRVFPTKWIPEYTLVAFSNTPQSECRAICKYQDRVMAFTIQMLWLAIFLLVLPLFFAISMIL